MGVKASMIYRDGTWHYFDKNGIEIVEGDSIRYDDGKVKKVYPTEEGHLGTDATNPIWIERGKAVPCEYGIYPIEEKELEGIEKVQ